VSKAKVLFLCTGNSARSQMAEALLRHHAGDRFEAFSAGIAPKGIHPYARRVLEEIGLSMAGQYSKDVREYLGRINFGYLITLCSDAEKNCPTAFLGVSQRMHWAIDDPAAFQGSDEARLAKFRQVRDQIDEKIRDWLVEQGILMPRGEAA
jgi:arsenate reductase